MRIQNCVYTSLIYSWLSPSITRFNLIDIEFISSLNQLLHVDAPRKPGGLATRGYRRPFLAERKLFALFRLFLNVASVVLAQRRAKQRS